MSACIDGVESRSRVETDKIPKYTAVDQETSTSISSVAARQQYAAR